MEIWLDQLGRECGGAWGRGIVAVEAWLLWVCCQGSQLVGGDGEIGILRGWFARRRSDGMGRRQEGTTWGSCASNVGGSLVAKEKGDVLVWSPLWGPERACCVVWELLDSEAGDDGIVGDGWI